MTHVAESHCTRLLRIKVVGTIDAVSERGGRMLVHQAKHWKAGNLGCIQQCLSVDVRVVGGHADHAVSDLALSPLLGKISELRQEHRRDLHR
mmetsp:Transcript_76217/g.182361  ORF Transcript_76217/g.182361 Transcript_76217/m.182361 type:complete len:92 (-) Transcript_76217:386-661(-)